MCHYKDGIPHLAESYDPEEGYWYADFGPRSVNYNHSTYCDLIITGLAGFRVQNDGSVKINPLIPASWDHMALRNIPFRNRSVDIIFDRTGKNHGMGRGLFLLADGHTVAQSSLPGEKLFWRPE